MADWIQAADGAVLLWIQNTLRFPSLDGMAAIFTTLGNAGLLFIGLSLILLFHKRTRRAGALALCAMALGFLCTNVALKPLVARPRPFVTLPWLETLVTEGDPYSFPSGHTTAAFAAACAWLRGGLPRRGAAYAGLALAVLMGVSRLYVGVHYPSDVLVGAGIGFLCAQVCAWLAESRLHGKLTGREGRTPS